MRTRVNKVWMASAGVLAGAAGVVVYLLVQEPPTQGETASAAADAPPVAASASPDSAAAGKPGVPVHPSAPDRGAASAAMASLEQRAATMGYGNFVSSARVSADPQAKFEAAKLLSQCEKIDSVVDRHRAHVGQDVGPGKSNAAFMYALDHDEQVRRHCQAITAEQYGQQLALLEEAVRGSVPGAALMYAMKIPVATANTLPWLVDALRRDADLGDIGAMRAMACDTMGDSLPARQRRAYWEALQTVAKGKSAASFTAAAIVEYCARTPDPNVGADPAAVQGLVARAMTFDS